MDIDFSDDQFAMFRKLTETEISQLIRQNNSADNWDNISVVGTFFVDKVKNCNFAGSVTIGENCAVENVGLLKDYRIGNGCTIRNVGEISFSSARKYVFSLAVCNEKNKYMVDIEPEMNTTDVFCALYIAKPDLFSARKGKMGRGQQYDIGHISDNVVITNTLSVKDSIIGAGTTIEDCIRIENSWIGGSSNIEERRSKVGAGVTLKNAIIGRDSVIDSNSVISSVLIGCSCEVSEGARIYESVIGDCSQVAGCEIGHSFLYPFHSQHHSNSFLIAAHVGGQCNIAAGATLGSNHNGRTNDGEFEAGRGFWAGLCASIAMPSHFAPFTLLVKGDYPHPLNISLAFSLVSNNLKDNRLEILPAYWWMHNAYSLFRNELKFKARDKRKEASQIIDYQPLAPDTIISVVESHRLLKKIIKGEISTEDFEASGREVRVLKAEEAIKAYESMILCYLLRTFGDDLAEAKIMNKHLKKVDFTSDHPQYLNAGGQILSYDELEEICIKAKSTISQAHQLQNDFHEEKNNKNIRESAIFAFKYLLDEGESLTWPSLNSGLFWERVAHTATLQEILFYERVIQKRASDLESPMRTMVNTCFKRCWRGENDEVIETAKNKIANLIEKKINLERKISNYEDI